MLSLFSELLILIKRRWFYTFLMLSIIHWIITHSLHTNKKMDTHINWDNFRAFMGLPHLTKCKWEPTYSKMEIIKKGALLKFNDHHLILWRQNKGAFGYPHAWRDLFQRKEGYFVIPDDMGCVSVFTVVETDCQREISRAQKKAARKVFGTCNTVIQACCIMYTKAIDSDYFSDINDPDEGLWGCTPIDIH